MANPPGCPDRDVVEIVLPSSGPGMGKGAFLKLHCGHWQWLGGFGQKEADRVLELHKARVMFKRPCLEGPCYKHQKAMGEACYDG